MRSKEASVTVFTGVTEATAPPMTAALSFDPQRCRKGARGLRQGGIALQLDANLKPTHITQREREREGTVPMDLWT